MPKRRRGGAGYCHRCGKLAHLTREKAMDAVREWPFDEDDGESLSVFRCRRGGPGWHVGHNTPPPPPPPRRVPTSYLDW